MLKITGLNAREILDSRGMPTLEVQLAAEEVVGVASVPAGASTGSHEAVELRDGEARFGGKGVRKAVGAVEGEIAAALVGRSFDQAALDALLCACDGTEQKSRLGANALLGVSLAFARAAAAQQQVPLYRYFASCAGEMAPAMPRPLFNVLNGGKHADNPLSFQEFMLVPKEFSSLALCLERAAAVIAALRQQLQAAGYAVSVGDEGGFAPALTSNEAALDFLVGALKSAQAEAVFGIGIDAAASSFYTSGTYALSSERHLSRADLLAHYQKLQQRYPLLLIEDPFAEDDWEGFAAFTEQAGSSLLVVGDDLVVTQTARIREAGEKKAVNAAIIKPNQVGTLSEAIAAVGAVRAQGWVPIASHRSGETTDTSIADFAVGLACPYLKAGSLARGERVVKYNRLLEIEQHLTRP